MNNNCNNVNNFLSYTINDCNFDSTINVKLNQELKNVIATINSNIDCNYHTINCSYDNLRQTTYYDILNICGLQLNSQLLINNIITGSSDNSTLITLGYFNDNSGGGGGDSIEATLLSSNELKFDNAYQYGTIAAPRTGDITINFTDAKLGMIQTMYHDDTELPAEILSNAKFLVVWGFYEPDTVNRLSFELIDKTVDSEMILVTIIPVE